MVAQVLQTAGLMLVLLLSSFLAQEDGRTDEILGVGEELC